MQRHHAQQPQQRTGPQNASPGQTTEYLSVDAALFAQRSGAGSGWALRVRATLNKALNFGIQQRN